MSHKVSFTVGSVLEVAEYCSNRTHPAIVLVDINVNDSRGIDTVIAIRKAMPTTEMIVITGEYKQEFVIKCVENGASGFLYKPFSMQKLKEAIEKVATIGSYLDAISLTELISSLQKPGTNVHQKILDTLTQKEEPVLKGLLSGKSAKQIASDLSVSTNTINFHLKNIYQKFNVHSKAELMSKVLSV